MQRLSGIGISQNLDGQHFWKHCNVVEWLLVSLGAASRGDICRSFSSVRSGLRRYLLKSLTFCEIFQETAAWGSLLRNTGTWRFAVKFNVTLQTEWHFVFHELAYTVITFMTIWFRVNFHEGSLHDGAPTFYVKFYNLCCACQCAFLYNCG